MAVETNTNQAAAEAFISNFEAAITTVWDMLDDKSFYENAELKSAWQELEQLWINRPVQPTPPCGNILAG